MLHFELGLTWLRLMLPIATTLHCFVVAENIVSSLQTKAGAKLRKFGP